MKKEIMPGTKNLTKYLLLVKSSLLEENLQFSLLNQHNPYQKAISICPSTHRKKFLDFRPWRILKEYFCFGRV